MTKPEISTTLIDKESPLCKVPAHQQNLIQYFCLDELCFNKRLFCNACAKMDHKKHRIGRIDRLIEPLSLLNINSFHEDSEAIYNELKSKIEGFYDVIEELRDSFDRTLKQIEKTTVFQVKCILETFSSSRIQQVEDLFTSQSPNEEEVKNAISMINFLQFEGVEECYTVKNVCDIMICKMTKTLQKTYNKVDAVFEKLIKNIKENDFIMELRMYKMTLETEAKKKLEEGLKDHPSKSNSEQREEQDKTSEPETAEQLHQGILQKQHVQALNFLKIPIKKEKVTPKPSIVDKFKAFFDEQGDRDVQPKKPSQKERNIIVKRQA